MTPGAIRGFSFLSSFKLFSGNNPMPIRIKQYIFLLQEPLSGGISHRRGSVVYYF